MSSGRRDDEEAAEALTLVVPARPVGQPSGGDRYDAAVAAAWEARGRRVRVAAVPGSWPRPSGEDLAILEQVLDPPGAGHPVLIDGLVGCAAPEAVERCAARRPTAVLVHAVLSEGAGATGEDAALLDRSEARALRAADVVVATSRFAAQDLRRRYGVDRVAVATPGVAPAPVAAGTPPPRGPQLLALGAVTPVKNHEVLVEALGQLRDLSWCARLVGPAPDPEHLDRVLRLADDLGVADRLDQPGPLAGDALERVWAATDLLVHPSRSETYGMVVAEAHAHGIPTVVAEGTGAVEALAGDAEVPVRAGRTWPGEAVEVSRPGPLAEVLRTWLSSRGLRDEWREAALTRRRELGGWERTTEQLDAALAMMGR